MNEVEVDYVDTNNVYGVTRLANQDGMYIKTETSSNS
jgi:hypothetical protein